LTNDSNLEKNESPISRFYVLSLLCAAVFGIFTLFIFSFIWFKPDQLSLADRYFPSPTTTSTRTPTSTPTPNLTATQRVIQTTSTSQAIQTTIAHANSQWNILISDSFNSTKNKWGLSSEDAYAKITRTITGTYKWEAKSKQGFISWKTAFTKPVADFILTAEAQRIEGTRSSDYGLIFREDIGNFYYFGIDGEGFFVSLNYNNEWFDLIDWTSSSAILPASPNHLTVIAMGSHFTFLINNQLVAMTTDDRIPIGKAGLGIQIYQSNRHAIFEFDNFKLREP
jgi:hypothetical protein